MFWFFEYNPKYRKYHKKPKSYIDNNKIWFCSIRKWKETKHFPCGKTMQWLTFNGAWNLNLWKQSEYKKFKRILFKK